MSKLERGNSDGIFFTLAIGIFSLLQMTIFAIPKFAKVEKNTLFWDDTSSYDANICFWLPQFHGLNLIFHKVPFTILHTLPAEMFGGVPVL